jgi:DNA-binding LacI/PurR family transcriptional regulator
MDNFHAGYAIWRHLVARGAKKIAFLMHEDWAPSVKERIHGLSMAVAEAGFGWRPERNVIPCRPDDEKGISRAIRVFRVDAIACGNDNKAAKLLKTLSKLGVSVPGSRR